MEEPTPPSAAGAPARASSRKRKSPVNFEDEPNQSPTASKRPRKGVSSSARKKPSKPPKAPKAPRKKPTRAPRKKEQPVAADKPTEDDVCAEEPDEEELALGEAEDDLAILGEEPEDGIQEPAKRRVAQLTKARNVAAGDTEPEFVGEPIPDDDARTTWPKCYEQPKKTSRQHDEEDVKARRHYTSAKVDGEIYSLGDDVYVMAGEKEADYIGRITELFEGVDLYKYFTCRWFFHPEDTVISRAKFVDDHKHDPKRVFLSEDKNDNALDCIISKVKIIQVDPNMDPEAKAALVADTELYYDMSYTVAYSSFANNPSGCSNNG